MKVVCLDAIGVKFNTSKGVIEINGWSKSPIIGVKEYVTDVADEVWREIQTLYAHTPQIQLKTIFADEKIENVKAYAKEMANEKFDDTPLDPAELKNIKPRKSK